MSVNDIAKGARAIIGGIRGTGRRTGRRFDDDSRNGELWRCRGPGHRFSGAHAQRISENGWLGTRGKYTLDEKGILHSHAAIGAEFVDVKTATAGVSLQTLEGLSFTELKRRIAARTGRVQ